MKKYLALFLTVMLIAVFAAPALAADVPIYDFNTVTNNQLHEYKAWVGGHYELKNSLWEFGNPIYGFVDRVKDFNDSGALQFRYPNNNNSLLGSYNQMTDHTLSTTPRHVSFMRTVRAGYYVPPFNDNVADSSTRTSYQGSLEQLSTYMSGALSKLIEHAEKVGFDGPELIAAKAKTGLYTNYAASAIGWVTLYNNLLEALGFSEPVIDKTALDAIIAEAQGIIDGGLGKYTDSSVSFFLSDYGDALTVQKNANATQEAVDKAVAELRKRIDNLVLVTVYHTVTFTDWDGAVLDEQQVEHGVAAIAPVDPQREGYSFIGWDVDFSAVSGDLVVTAQYEINTYTVGFRVFDGYWSIGYSQQVKQGESIDWAAVESEYPFYNGKTWADVELWCNDANGNPLWNLNQPITDDLVLFPKFYEVQEPEPELVSVTPTASVKKLNGNKNDLTITVIEEYSDGSTVVFAETFSISNNATGTYNVGSYKVYVDTKGNDQIRACYLVE